MQRLTNGLRKIAAGLRPFSESVWPGVRNDLFVAHESIYEFFANDVQGERVLDAGCGTGYGARRLLDAGARTVVGVDIDALNIRYAKRHYGAANLRFMRADIQRLEFPKSSFGNRHSLELAGASSSPGNIFGQCPRHFSASRQGIDRGTADHHARRCQGAFANPLSSKQFGDSRVARPFS